jgi:hypothetical protein
MKYLMLILAAVFLFNQEMEAGQYQDTCLSGPDWDSLQLLTQHIAFGGDSLAITVYYKSRICDSIYQVRIFDIIYTPSGADTLSLDYLTSYVWEYLYSTNPLGLPPNIPSDTAVYHWQYHFIGCGKYSDSIGTQGSFGLIECNDEPCIVHMLVKFDGCGSMSVLKLWGSRYPDCFEAITEEDCNDLCPKLNQYY